MFMLWKISLNKGIVIYKPLKDKESQTRIKKYHVTVFVYILNTVF